MYTVTVLHNGDIAEEPLRSQLVLLRTVSPCGNGTSNTRPSPARDAAPTATVAPSPVLEVRHSDPNTNGRTYSYAVDHGDVLDVQDDGIFSLRPSFIFKKGLCWIVAVVPYGDEVTNREVLTPQLLEDG